MRRSVSNDGLAVAKGGERWRDVDFVRGIGNEQEYVDRTERLDLLVEEAGHIRRPVRTDAESNRGGTHGRQPTEARWWASKVLGLSRVRALKGQLCHRTGSVPNGPVL